MRIYDPKEDLPPDNAIVYCGVEYENFGSKATIQCEATWCPYEGWKTTNGARVRVVKWCDMSLPKLVDVTRSKDNEEE